MKNRPVEGRFLYLKSENFRVLKNFVLTERAIENLYFIQSAIEGIISMVGSK